MNFVSRYDNVILEPEVLGMAEFARAASGVGVRSVLHIRHAQRPPIDAADPTFGFNLPITEEGRADTVDAGRLLSPLRDCASFLASPCRRTMATAQAIAEGMGIAGAEVMPCDEIGLNGLFMADARECFSSYHARGAVACTDQYMREGSLPGYEPMEKGAERYFRWLTETRFCSKCAVLVGHDVFIAALLVGLGMRRFDTARWLGVLQGAALVRGPGDDKWHVSYCVADPGNYANTFFQ